MFQSAIIVQNVETLKEGFSLQTKCCNQSIATFSYSQGETNTSNSNCCISNSITMEVKRNMLTCKGKRLTKIFGPCLGMGQPTCELYEDNKLQETRLL